jgi:phage-related minor tail protein
MLQKTQSGESGKHIDKATALFNSLQDQYIDRLDRIKTQQHLLSKQTSILNDKKNTIDVQKKNLDTHTDKLHTRRRLMIYDENDDRFSIRLAYALKCTLLVASIILIILLAKRN